MVAEIECGAALRVRLFADGLVVMTYVGGGPPETEADWRRCCNPYCKAPVMGASQIRNAPCAIRACREPRPCPAASIAYW